MKKYIFTESQIKKIVDATINEQTSENYEGVISTVNGKKMVIATSEMGTKKTFPLNNLKINVADNTPVFVQIINGQAKVWGPNPKNPKGPTVPYN